MSSPRPNPLIYGDYERLVTIVVQGRTFEVPEGIPLIRAFQYIQFELAGMKSDWSRFCFNDTIGCCNLSYCRPGEAPTTGRACCLRVEADLEVVQLPEGSTLLPPEAP